MSIRDWSALGVTHSRRARLAGPAGSGLFDDGPEPCLVLGLASLVVDDFGDPDDGSAS